MPSKKITKENEKALFYDLKCPIMNYDWGQEPKKSFIRQLLRDENLLFLSTQDNSDQANIDSKESKKIAELWMGAHPRASAQISFIQKKNEKLSDAILSDPSHYLGSKLAKRGHKRLSFLFKLIEIAKPLSIQIHPDKKMAKKLHLESPGLYPDSNHKPELAVCIKDMTALIGFRPINEIYYNLARIKKFSILYDLQLSDLDNRRPFYFFKYFQKKYLKKIYTRLMKAPPWQVEEIAKSHLKNLKQSKASKRIEDILFTLFVKDYGLQDPAIFSSYFLNYVAVKPGDALFLASNTPHSYLSGIVLECMASSDNVLRGGLSSKYCDLLNFLNLVSYKSGRINFIKARRTKKVEKYFVPVKDFNFSCYESECSKNILPGTETEFKLADLNRPSILLGLGSSSIVSGTKLSIQGKTETGKINNEIQAELIFRKKVKGKIIKRQKKIKVASVIFLPGDLAERNVKVSLRIKKRIKIYRVSSPASIFRHSICARLYDRFFS